MHTRLHNAPPHSERADKGKHCGDKRCDGWGQCLRDIVDVVCHTAHYIAMAVGIEIFYRKSYKAWEQVFTHGLYCVLWKLCREYSLHIGENRGQEINCPKTYERFAKWTEVNACFLFGEGNAVYGYLLYWRCGKIEQSYDEHYTDKCEKQISVPAYIADKLFKGVLCVLRLFHCEPCTVRSARFSSAGSHWRHWRHYTSPPDVFTCEA